MNHKRGRPKNRRAGCLMCKPNKVNGAKQNRGLQAQGHRGFSAQRKRYFAGLDMLEML